MPSRSEGQGERVYVRRQEERCPGLAGVAVPSWALCGVLGGWLCRPSRHRDPPRPVSQGPPGLSEPFTGISWIHAGCWLHADSLRWGPPCTGGGVICDERGPPSWARSGRVSPEPRLACSEPGPQNLGAARTAVRGGSGDTSRIIL